VAFSVHNLFQLWVDLDRRQQQLVGLACSQQQVASEHQQHLLAAVSEDNQGSEHQ